MLTGIDIPVIVVICNSTYTKLRDNMSLINTPTWRYTILLVEDQTIGGYTAFFAEFPNIVVEGETKEEAKQKLFDVAQSVFDFKRKQALNERLLKNTAYSVEPYNAELSPA